jgi:hypothetical protein
MIGMLVSFLILPESSSWQNCSKDHDEICPEDLINDPLKAFSEHTEKRITTAHQVNLFLV